MLREQELNQRIEDRSAARLSQILVQREANPSEHATQSEQNDDLGLTELFAEELPEQVDFSPLTPVTDPGASTLSTISSAACACAPSTIGSLSTVSC